MARARQDAAAQPGREPAGTSARRRNHAGKDVLGSERERVAEFQRSRLLRSVVEVAAERGYAAVSVTAILARARVSSKTFYEFFAGWEDCLLAACEQYLKRVAEVAAEAYDGEGEWAQRLRDALTASLDFLDAERPAGRLAVAFLLGAGPESDQRRARPLAVLTEVLDDALGEDVAAPPPSPLAAEVLLAGALGVVHARIGRQERPLVELVNPLMSMLVLPYLGPGAAARELERIPPRRQPMRPRRTTDTVRDLGVRLTYRTARVIAVIAARPGLSNREVAAAAGIRDQSQISRLLARLAGIDVVVNAQPDRMSGLPNAWRLTSIGRDVHDAIARDSARKR